MIFGRELIDEKCIDQLDRCIGPNDIGVLTADAHYGYGHPIGGAVAYRDHISLSGVGFDIACGNKAVRTNVRVADVDIAHVMDEVYRRISFGMGRPNNEPADHAVLEAIRTADVAEQRGMAQLAANQLGTVGGGNHFVDLFEDEEGWLWIGVHFGSRGFGHKTTMGFIALSQGLPWGDRVKEGGMEKPPILFEQNSEMGQRYVAAMQLAGDYAHAGRDQVVSKVLDILGNPEVTYQVHNHHNFAWLEEHGGIPYWVVRKGCTPAAPGQEGFIGANMFDTSVVVQGLDTELNRAGLYSTVHGAGRVMSRTQAAGKKKYMKGWSCSNRDRNGSRPNDTPMGTDGSNPKCPKCQSTMRKREWTEIIAPGLVDFAAVQQRMQAARIELRGAGADEAPQCYKKLEDVLGAHAGTIKVLHRLRPVGVAMAGADVEDPYKD